MNSLAIILLETLLLVTAQNNVVDSRNLETTSESQVPKIIGGEPTEIKYFPYQLSLRKMNYHVCGASVIAEKWTITAASCIDFDPPVGTISIMGGSTNYKDAPNGILFKAVKYVYHPKYDRPSLFDVALILVDKPLIGENIQPIRLTTQEMPLYSDHKVVATGWGETNDEGLENILHKVELPIVAVEQCNSSWNGRITRTMLCAGKKNLDTCSGDNGGPLAYCNVLLGITILSSDNCDGENPAGFTNLAHPEVRSFIRKEAGV